ncbi:MAG: DUF1570 domain-containing protein [Thermoguttaceae bacterium]|nr:DUF1570 domain-containing protein [Thermoguttaceae bacterium]
MLFIVRPCDCHHAGRGMVFAAPVRFLALALAAWAALGVFLCAALAQTDGAEPVLTSAPKTKTIHLVLKPEDSKRSDSVRTERPTDVIARLIVDYRGEDRSGNLVGFAAVLFPDGRLEVIPHSDIVLMEETDESFRPLDAEELGEQLSAEAGVGFKILKSRHFLFVYNTSEAYAAWCSKLFETLYLGFDKYQTQRGLNLSDPEFVMPVIIFPNREVFTNYAERDMLSAEGIVAYYNRVTNRVVLYDLSEEETAEQPRKGRRLNSQQIAEFLARPNAELNVSTIVHEATHQIAFNRKMFPRTGPYPLWLVEGLSMAFETPSKDAAAGWNRRYSAVHPNLVRHRQLISYLEKMPADPIRDILRSNQFEGNLLDSYAVAWGLFHYLNMKQPKKLSEYIKLVAQKYPYQKYTPEERLADFEAVFGDDWERFYKGFVRYMTSIK